MTKKSLKEDKPETNYETPYKQLKIGKNNHGRSPFETESGK